MAKRATKINVILYLPDSQEGTAELAHRIASVHADTVLNRIKKLECPSKQKNTLLDAIIAETQKETQSSSKLHKKPYVPSLDR